MNFKKHCWLFLLLFLPGFTSWASDLATSTQPATTPWRKDPRFAKFVPDPALPQMIVLDKTKVQVETALTLNLGALSTISDQDRNALAKLLNVPQSVCSKCLAALASQKITDADVLVKELRAKPAPPELRVVKKAEENPPPGK